MLYDADCGVCTWLLALLLRWDRDRRLRPVALAGAEAQRLLSDLTPPERMASWHLISPDGERLSAGAALPAVLRLLPGAGAAAVGVERAPRLTERGYWWVAGHRSALGRMVPAAAKRWAGRCVQQRERADDAG